MFTINCFLQKFDFCNLTVVVNIQEKALIGKSLTLASTFVLIPNLCLRCIVRFFALRVHNFITQTFIKESCYGCEINGNRRIACKV